jgi:nucleolar GTP-binding protein
MPLYNFKKMAPVPTHTDFVDVVLSRTQRKTPTVCHRGWAISRIRAFYTRKVKFTQQTYHDKISRILDEFPRLDDIHPFYSDLCNVLYDRDHYKLALGQMSMARQLIDNLAKDYVRLLKYADSQYRAKQLKRAALGRMCTLMRKMGPSLGYLEEVRKHLSRLPSIDPNTRTLLITGYPNVGKSSFMNKVTRADVEVQPYAFTTKSLYVGHMDYKYLRWQVIDTPGILDHPLEERNTIEMCAITALAHLQCTVMYFLDLSEMCGYTIDQQMELFNNIKPLFANKALMLVFSKSDLTTLATLDEETRAKVLKWAKVAVPEDANRMQLSSATEEGISAVKTRACDILLEKRVAAKLRGRKLPGVMNRLTVANPVARDASERARQEATVTSIPQSVVDERARKAAAALVNGTKGEDEDEDDMMMDVEDDRKKTQKDIMNENGGAGIWAQNWREHWQLKNNEWRTDGVPEIMDGKNIADFVDPDIMKKLEMLEKEEEELDAQMDAESSESEVDEDERAMVSKIKERRKMMVHKSRNNKHNNRPTIPRKHRIPKTGDAFRKSMGARGLDTSKVDPDQHRGRKRTRNDRGDDDGDDPMGLGSLAPGEGTIGGRTRASGEGPTSTGISRSQSRSRHPSKRPKPKDQQGITEQLGIKARKMMKTRQRKMNILAKAGESDRHIREKKPKHLYSGKSGSGTRDRR